MKPRSHGFTLLELLIAMAIFAVVATLAHGGLQALIRSHEATDRATLDLQELRRAWLLLEADLAQSIPRPARDPGGTLRPAFILTGERLEFTRTVEDARVLQRVEYRLQGAELYRYEWPVGDLAPDSVPRTGLVLAELKGFTLQAILGGRQAVRWPQSNPGDVGSPLPDAVEVRLSRNGRDLRWLLPVNG